MDFWNSKPEDAGSDPDWISNLIKEQVDMYDTDSKQETIVNSILEGHRLGVEDAKYLYDTMALSNLATLANTVKKARHGDKVYFNRNLHVNQTNVCVLACRFCAFRRGPRADDAYSLGIDDYLSRIRPFERVITEVHTVGGLHPDWRIDHYENLFRTTKEEFPEISIKALTAVEIKHLAEISDLTIKETLTRLKSAGLDSLPGGGAEILVDRVRDIICRGKESSQEYLDIHRYAHEIGLPTNSTMLFGSVETIDERLIHLDSLRLLQDETAGFQCFVPYPFLPDSTRLPEAQLASSSEILRVIAISRLMLDNFPHIKAYRMNLGDKVAQMALTCGADDIDGTVGHEEIMHLAGSSTPLDDDMGGMVRMISQLGMSPVERNTTYTRFQRRDRKNPPPSSGSRLPMAA